MTMMSKEKIECPACKKTQTAEIYQTINATLNRDLRLKLLNGEINQFKCNSCGHEEQLPVPLLYHDMKLDFVVWYHPAEYLDQDDFYQDFLPDGKLNLTNLKQNEYMSNPHMVFDLTEMLVYITFRERLYEYYNPEKPSCYKSLVYKLKKLFARI